MAMLNEIARGYIAQLSFDGNDDSSPLELGAAYFGQSAFDPAQTVSNLPMIFLNTNGNGVKHIMAEISFYDSATFTNKSRYISLLSKAISSMLISDDKTLRREATHVLLRTVEAASLQTLFSDIL